MNNKQIKDIFENTISSLRDRTTDKQIVKALSEILHDLTVDYNGVSIIAQNLDDLKEKLRR